MEKIKFCPNCQKQVALDVATCDCGFEFYIPEEKDDGTVVTNTKVIVDNKPLGLWIFLGFITCGILGIILGIKFKNDYPARSKASFKGAIAFAITLGACILIYVFYLILNAKGKIV